MKNLFFGTIFFFVILNGMVRSQECCLWSEYFDSLECGIRQPGDQLLFTDIRTSNWTFEISNRLEVEYTNVYITWWKVDLSNTWYAISRTVYNPYFRLSAQSSNSTLFSMNITAYGFETNDVEVPYGCNLHNDEKHTFTNYNPKYQLN